MDKTLLLKHIKDFVAKAEQNEEQFMRDYEERLELIRFYKKFTADKIQAMDPETVYEYLSGLWAMLIWGNKHYVVDKIIEDNGLEKLKSCLVDLIWGKNDISDRWDKFRLSIKGMGPAMISELLCKTHPDDFMLWNRRAYVGLDYLKVKDLPRHDYQLTGKKYKHLCAISKEIAVELGKNGFKDTTLLAVDYIIWDELQVEKNLARIHAKKSRNGEDKIVSPEESKFIHDDIRDKLRDIGRWLGFEANIERKVADGAKVDAVWEATIGNMGRVIYVFEVQTKGSIDSLIINLLKAINNPAVQGVVAVSDKQQIETIRKNVAGVKDLRDKLKYWDYENVLKVHESLEFVNSSINELGLVPEGF